METGKGEFVFGRLPTKVVPLHENLGEDYRDN